MEDFVTDTQIHEYSLNEKRAIIFLFHPLLLRLFNGAIPLFKFQ